MEKKVLLQSLLTIIAIFGITTALFLYTAGYRINRGEDKFDIRKTGMIGAKSIPEGASVYLNGQLVTATNDTVSSLNPGTYNLKIFKKGFVDWNKQVEVFPELVTDITAVLISQTPRLEPLTNTGARFPSISPTLTKMAYFSKDPSAPGVWVIPFVQGGLSLFRSNSQPVLEDTARISYSQGTSIEWSPDETELLVGEPNNVFYLVDMQSNTAESTTSPELIRETWLEELTKKRTDFIEKLDLPENIRVLATSKEAVWSPDEKKFLYTQKTENTVEYRVYNMEKPLPIGEKVENIVLTAQISEPQPKISWYADSFHLILSYADIEKEKRGSINLIRIDGTNKTEVYNNTLYSDLVYSAPAGDKLIILTSFKSPDQTDLYTIGIR